MNASNQTHPFCLKVAAIHFLSSFLPALFFFSSIQAQQGRYKATEITQVPFTTFTGGVVVVKARLLGHPDTLNFIMDTGSAGISLDSSTCLRLKLKPELTDKLIMGIGGVRQLSYVRNLSLLYGNIQVDSLDFHVSDYDILSIVYGDRIDGIIGYSFFSPYSVRIDYDSNVLYVYNRSNF